MRTEQKTGKVWMFWNEGYEGEGRGMTEPLGAFRETRVPPVQGGLDVDGSVCW